MRDWISIALRPDVLARSARIALVVGTLLALINHGDRILSLSLDSRALMKIGLSYLVPFAVATWSATQALRR